MKKDKVDKKKIFKIILMVYFMVSPFFEVVFLYKHVTTLLRVSCIFVFVIITWLLFDEARKGIKYLIAYYLAIIFYLGISYVHSKGFISLVPGDFNYSIFNEAMTLIKLCMPFSILFILKYVNFTYKDFFKVINFWVIIVAGSIVFFNLCGFSLSSYSNEITRFSIFSWSRNMNVLEVATKGWFAYANQEVIILLMVLVLTIYEVLFRHRKYIFSFLLVSLALIMLGTRVGTYGGLLTLLFMIIAYLIYSLLCKKKLNKWVSVLALSCLGWFLILPYTPCQSRVLEIEEASKTIYKEVTKEKKNTKKEVKDEKPMSDLEIFEQNINKNLVGEQFYLNFYPYNYDKEFWEDVLEKQTSMTLNYRVVENMIVKRVIELDGRKTNYWFGISNSRIQNLVNVEQDFVLHFYAFGIVGMIITLLFYAYSFVIISINVLKRKTFIDFSILVCLGLFVLGAFMSGNNVNFLAATIPLAFIVGMSNTKVNSDFIK